MPTKKKLLEKLYAEKYPKNFSVQDLDSLLSKCGCEKFQGGRGSGVKYYHIKSKRILQFDLPHPGKELYRYHITALKNYLATIGESEE